MKRIYDEEKAKEEEIERRKESNRNTWFYQDADEEIIGPIGIEKIIKLIESRKIKRKTLVRQKSKSQWTKAWETSLSMYFDNEEMDSINKRPEKKKKNDVGISVLESIIKFFFASLFYIVFVFPLVFFVVMMFINPSFFCIGCFSIFGLGVIIRYKIQKMF